MSRKLLRALTLYLIFQRTKSQIVLHMPCFQQMQQSQFKQRLMQGSFLSDSQEPQLLKDLKGKVSELGQSLEETQNENKFFQQKVNEKSKDLEYFTKQKQIQDKKSKSLNLLVNELQNSLEKATFQAKAKELESEQNLEVKLAIQNQTIRHELIKMTEKNKQDERLKSFLRQIELNKGRIQEFVKKSNYIENQTELLAKLRSQVRNFQNENLECRRKWNGLHLQRQRNEKNLSVFKIQCERQKQVAKELYEEYLEKINRSKTRIVNFNETQREKLLTEFLVEEMATIQQSRVQVQDENRNLRFHLQNLKEEQERVEIQNSQLNSFFYNDNRMEESKLALKMKARIQELRDSLIEAEKRNSSDRIAKINANLQFVRGILSKHKELNDFLQLKLKNLESGKFDSLDERAIAEFFTGVLKGKDEKITLSTERCTSLRDELRQLQMKQLLLENQVGNLQEALESNSIENEYTRNAQLSRKS